MIDDAPYAPPQAELADRERTDPSEAEAIRARFLPVETHLRRLGLATLLAGVFGAVSGTVWIVRSEGAPVAVAVTALGAAAVPVGLGLRSLVPAARRPAQALGLALFVLALFNLAGGTALAGYLIYLVSTRDGARVLSASYANVVRQTPHLEPKPLGPAWIVLGLLAAVLGVGCWYAGRVL